MAALTPIEVSCFDRLEACGVSEREWDDFLLGLRAEVFLSHAWTRTWFSHYGAGRTLRLFVIRQGGALAGLLPLFYEDHGWAASGARVAKQVGVDFTLASLSLPIRDDAIEPALEHALAHLFECDRCDAVRFGPVTDRPRLHAALRSVAERSGWPPPRETTAGSASLVGLPDSFEAYFASLGRKTRQNFTRTWKHLCHDFQVESEMIVAADDAVPAFGEFAAMHARQWQDTGEAGHFDDWPGSLAFHQALLPPLAAIDRLLLFRLKADDKPIAYRYCLGMGPRLFALLPARETGSAWQSFGLGRLAFIAMAKLAIERGCREIDLGGAYWPYKRELGGRDVPLVTITLAPSRLGKVRLGWLIAYATLLDAVYYKLWFKRVAPRLPWRRGVLRRHWIRLAPYALPIGSRFRAAMSGRGASGRPNAPDGR